MLSKRVVLDIVTMVELFDMDGTPPNILDKDHPGYRREKVVKLLFPNQKDYMSSGKILTASLSVEDRLFNFIIVKCILPQSTNTTSIMEDGLFLL